MEIRFVEIETNTCFAIRRWPVVPAVGDAVTLFDGETVDGKHKCVVVSREWMDGERKGQGAVCLFVRWRERGS
jgi:hypothetical protein